MNTYIYVYIYLYIIIIIITPEFKKKHNIRELNVFVTKSGSEQPYIKLM